MPTREITEYISALFLLISTAIHTEIYQYGIYGTKDNYEYDDDSMMSDINDPESVSHA